MNDGRVEIDTASQLSIVPEVPLCGILDTTNTSMLRRVANAEDCLVE